MSYESAIIEALGLTAPPGDAPAAVAAALAQLTTSVGNWREMHGVSNTSDLVDFVVARILDQLQIPHSLMKRWGS